MASNLHPDWFHRACMLAVHLDVWATLRFRVSSLIFGQPSSPHLCPQWPWRLLDPEHLLVLLPQRLRDDVMTVLWLSLFSKRALILLQLNRQWSQSKCYANLDVFLFLYLCSFLLFFPIDSFWDSQKVKHEHFGSLLQQLLYFMLYSLSRRWFLIHYDQQTFVSGSIFPSITPHPHNPHTHKHNSLKHIVARLGWHQWLTISSSVGWMISCSSLETFPACFPKLVGHVTSLAFNLD